MDLEERMKALAERGHAGQLRKDGRTPYVEHPRAVVALLRRWGVARSSPASGPSRATRPRGR